MKISNIISLCMTFFIGTSVESVSVDCLQACTINTYGTPWNFANLRPTPCNNRRPYAELQDGDVVYNLNNNRFGCGYWYTQIVSGNKVGWVASQFLDCNGNPPVPAAAIAEEQPTTVGTAL